MITISQEAKAADLLEVVRFLEDIPKETAISENLWMQVINHENINYEVWAAAFKRYPNQVWDNRVVDFVVFESATDAFDLLYNCTRLKQNLITNSLFYKQFIDVYLPKRTQQEDETKARRKAIEARIIAEETSKYGFSLGDIVLIEGSDSAVYQITAFRAMVNEEVSTKVNGATVKVTPDQEVWATVNGITFKGRVVKLINQITKITVGTAPEVVTSREMGDMVSDIVFDNQSELNIYKIEGGEDALLGVINSRILSPFKKYTNPEREGSIYIVMNYRYKNQFCKLESELADKLKIKSL